MFDGEQVGEGDDVRHVEEVEHARAAKSERFAARSPLRRGGFKGYVAEGAAVKREGQLLVAAGVVQAEGSSQVGRVEPWVGGYSSTAELART
jgi:hypothetical protein